jgi:hypothetical protein
LGEGRSDTAGGVDESGRLRCKLALRVIVDPIAGSFPAYEPFRHVRTRIAGFLASQALRCKLPTFGGKEGEMNEDRLSMSVLAADVSSMLAVSVAARRWVSLICSPSLLVR